MEIVNSNGNEKEVVKKIELAVKKKILQLKILIMLIFLILGLIDVLLS